MRLMTRARNNPPRICARSTELNLTGLCQGHRHHRPARTLKSRIHQQPLTAPYRTPRYGPNGPSGRYHHRRSQRRRPHPQGAAGRGGEAHTGPGGG